MQIPETGTTAVLLKFMLVCKNVDKTGHRAQQNGLICFYRAAVHPVQRSERGCHCRALERP